MKVTVRKETAGHYSIYVAKKDLEARIVSAEQPAIWGGKVELDNGWTLEMPPMAADTRLPITVEARRLGEG
ncbi:putative nitrogen fixation protein NifT [Aromatoleum toluclasticum]|uniref:putative nitrogen fixation protein NifT n=1 Tax=Aromatoleum toluclasticum TaxID=92003 RepID=UPI001D17F775|nr:putative nitrogen fixation protein NifT [Aromatoleum toluclasticum]MCC4115145.1 putative nitrogen fixation protein NifT [Aromatoleum toluclasticum]